jgi:MscS family membrane protein
MFQQLLNTTYFNNTLSEYLKVAAIIIMVLFLKGILSKYLASLLAKLISRKNKPFNKARFQNLLLAPLELFLIIATIVFAIESLNYPEVLKFKIHKVAFATVLEGAANAAIIISLIWLCIRLLEYVAELLQEKATLTNDKTDDQLIIFFKDFFKVIIIIIGFLLIIRFGFGKSVTALLTGLSIVGAAVALAFRESMENLIASFVIFFDKPFTIGDLIKVQNITGTVERIGLRSSRIRTIDKTYVTVPNKQMVDTVLDNQTLRTQKHANTKLEIAIGATAAQLESVVSSIATMLSNEYDIEDKNVYLSDIGQRAHIVDVEYFVNAELSQPDFLKLRQKINLSIINMLAAAGVELAKPNFSVYK